MTAIILKSPHVLNHSSSHIIIFHHHSILVKKSQDLLEMNYHLVAICYHSSNDSKPKFVKISSSNSKIKVQYHPTSQLASAHEGKKRRKLTPPRPQRAPRQPQWRRCRRLCRPGLASTPASATTAKCNAMYRNSEWPFDTMKKVLTDSLYLSKKKSSDWRLWTLHSGVKFIYYHKATNIWQNISVS